MKRFYYMTQSLPSVTGINQDLAAEGIGPNRISVMGRDVAELERAHVHAVSPWDQTDVMHSGFLGAAVGLVIGLLVGLALMAIDPFGMSMNMWAVWIAGAFFLFHGAWFGGLVGLSRRNHHMLRYLTEVERGNYLVMVDADDEDQARRVHRVMSAKHREATVAGEEDGYSPFF